MIGHRQSGDTAAGGVSAKVGRGDVEDKQIAALIQPMSGLDT